jgi:hypothetical protein
VNPLPLAADVVIEWDSFQQVWSNMPVGHYRIAVGRLAPGQSMDVFSIVMAWLNANIGYAAAQIDNGTVTAQVPAVTTREPNWQTAPAALAWASAGLPWWGLVEAAARAGTWVRRLAWTDASRAIRFESGAGSSRAVAVQAASGLAGAERVTTADFGVAEFLAQDWQMLGQVSEPVMVDVTDFAFSGPSGSVLFTVGSRGSVDGGGGLRPTPLVLLSTRQIRFRLSQAAGGPVVFVGSGTIPMEPGAVSFAITAVEITQALPGVVGSVGQANSAPQILINGGASAYLQKHIFAQTGSQITVRAVNQSSGVSLQASDAPVFATVTYGIYGYGASGGGGGSIGGGAGGDPVDPVAVVPQTGRGFVYVRDGVSTLVPARDITGADWEP